METLHPDAALLLAYVDKQLSPEEILVAEKIIADDPEAKALVNTLANTELPFAEAFEFLLDDKDAEINSQSSASIPKNTLNVGRKWQWPASLAASLVLGMVIGYTSFSSKLANQESPLMDNWITEVANYQLLYVRETVTPAPKLSDTQQLALQEKLSNALDGGLIIPDLSKHNLSFRRGQLLDIAGNPLVQLAYLPDNGLPVALCVLRNNAEDSLPKTGNSRGLSYVEWSKNGLSYVIIGKTDQKNLEAAAMEAMGQIAI